MLADEVADILKELWQVGLSGLAAAAGEVVHAGDAGVEFMQGLADGVPRPAQLAFGLALAQAERLDRFRLVTPALGSVESLGRLLEQDTHGFCQFHGTNLQGEEGWHCTNFQRTNYFPGIASGNRCLPASGSPQRLPSNWADLPTDAADP